MVMANKSEMKRIMIFIFYKNKNKSTSEYQRYEITKKFAFLFGENIAKLLLESCYYKKIPPCLHARRGFGG